MEEKEIREKLEDFKKDFLLTDEELHKVANPRASDFTERVKKMDEVRRKRKEVGERIDERGGTKLTAEVMREWLFNYNLELRDSYFNSIIKGHFDAVIRAIEDLDLIHFREIFV